MLRAFLETTVSDPKGTDPRAPNAPPTAGPAFSDTILAARAAPATTGVAMAQPGDTTDARALAESVRTLPLGIQGIWIGLVCIVLLVGSAAALRSLFGGDTAAAVAPAASATVTLSIPTATSNGPPPLAEPTATSTGATLSIGGPGAAPSGVAGALAIRDRLASHVRLRKFGPFIDDLERLVEIEPAAIERADVRKMIADTMVFVVVPLPNGTMVPEADRLITFLTTRAGTAGPDILFDLVTTRGGSRAARIADDLLEKKDIQAKGTPAFQIANEFRLAKTCQERVKLYPRVKAEGDRRVLQFLFQMARCGKGPNDCCMGKDPLYKDAVQAINAKK